MLNDGGDCALSEKFNITVDPPPILFPLATPTIICEGNSSSLMVTGAETYTWSVGAISNSTTVSPLTTTVYTVTGTDSIDCQGIETITVNVINPSITVNSPTICLGEPATLTATGVNTYTWSTGSLSNSITIYPPLTTTFSVQGSDISGCKATKESTVEVINTIANFEGIDKSIFEFGQSIELLNTSLDANEFKWIYCNGSISTNTNVTVNLLDSGNCCIQLIAKRLQCLDTISKCFYVNPESYIIIPNVFTPNEDGSNEVFKLKTFGMKDLNCAHL